MAPALPTTTMLSYPIPLPRDVENSKALGTIHHPTDVLWHLEMHNGLDNRLTSVFIDGVLLEALNIVERDWRHGTKENGAPGALIISGKQDQAKFFSNGLDFNAMKDDTAFFPCIFNPFISRLLTFPIPTIAAITGHAFAAGFILALSCDYRVMTPGRGWASMNEVLFGATMPFSFAAILNYKLPSNKILREVVLEARRYTVKDLVELGLVDVVAKEATGPAILDAARELAMERAPLAKTGAWGLIKRDIARKALEIVNADYRQLNATQEAILTRSRL